MANQGMPSMLALLGLLAVAGYQNRDKIGQLLNEARANSGNSGTGLAGGQQDGLGGLISGLGGLLGGGSGTNGGVLSGGIGDLLERFKQTGNGDTAESWLKPGPNRTLTPQQVEDVVGAENIAELSNRTGLSRDELLKRLATNIPEGVADFTPDGRVPTEDEADRLFSRA